jgi:hypothetical protein
MKIKAAFKRICVLASLIVLARCASERINLVETGMVSLEIVAAKGISVQDADVYQDGDNLVIKGRITSIEDIDYLKNRNVDITILGPGGRVIRQASSRYMTKMLTFGPKDLSRTAAREAYFEEIIHVAIPEASTVRLEFHD